MAGKSGGRFELKTIQGYDLMEVSSAIQKSIRRGDEKVAIYFTVELYFSHFDNYLWKRLRIISSEDVGLAAPNISSEIYALHQMYRDFRKEYPEGKPGAGAEKLFLIHAVLMLCRAPKSRLVDWTLIEAFEGHYNEKMEIPDVAYDKHNGAGRRMGRGWPHFFEEGTKLENHQPQPGEDEAKAGSWKLLTSPKLPAGGLAQTSMFDEMEGGEDEAAPLGPKRFLD